jgi:hypothetical protein
LDAELVGQEKGVNHVNAIVNGVLNVERMEYGKQILPGYEIAIREI